MQATLNTDCGKCLGKIRIGQTECFKEKCRNSIVAFGISCDIHVHECNYNSLNLRLYYIFQALIIVLDMK